MTARRGRPATVWWALALAGIGAAHADVEPARDWPALKERGLETIQGSALDLSRVFPSHALGADDRVSIGKDGRFVLGSAGPQPLHCATQMHGPATGSFPNRAEADRVALELRRRGYNAVRFHFVEATLMTRRSGDFDFDPEQLDRLFYLLAALKKQGIHWIVDGMASTNGAMAEPQPNRWTWRYNFRLDIHWSESTRQHWVELMKRLWGRKNPYTGVSTLEDPALAGVILVNENNIRFLQQQGGVYPPLVDQFEQWLRGRMKDDEAVDRRWRGILGTPGQLKDVLGEAMRRPRGDANGRDVDAFLTELETGTLAWLSDAVVKLGYRGPVTAYHTLSGAQADATRSRLGWVDFHGYHDHPSGWPGPGASIRNTSSLGTGLDYLARASQARIPGKPFSVSEYGQPFWNSYRHEAAVTAPTLAARQQWSAACRFSENSVTLAYGGRNDRERLLTPFMTGLDPIARAGELLGALLYRRGDAAAARPLPAPLARLTGDTAIPGDGFALATERTEAAIVLPGTDAKLPNLLVGRASARAMVAAAAVDDASQLADSKRVLVWLLTDALNTGMRFADDSRRVIRDAGSMPVRVEPLRATLTLRNRHARGLQAWALSLDGKRQAELPLTVLGDDRVQVNVDTGAGDAGPYVFIEVVAR